MGSFALQNSCHPVWQRGIMLVDEVVPCRHPKAPPSSLAWSSKLPPSSSPDMHNNINIWRLCWPSLKDLDLLPPEKLHSGT